MLDAENDIFMIIAESAYFNFATLIPSFPRQWGKVPKGGWGYSGNAINAIYPIVLS